MSIKPRKIPITTETATTIIVSLVVSSLVGQVTLLSSEYTSPKTRKLNAFFVASVLTLRVAFCPRAKSCSTSLPYEVYVPYISDNNDLIRGAADHYVCFLTYDRCVHDNVHIRD